MKKSNLVIGILSAVAGFGSLTAGLVLESGWAGVLLVLAGALLSPGVYLICRYFYLNNEKNTAKRLAAQKSESARQEAARVELEKQTAGRNAHITCTIISGFALAVFLVLWILGVLTSAWITVIYIAAYMALQILLWINGDGKGKQPEQKEEAPKPAEEPEETEEARQK